MDYRLMLRDAAGNVQTIVHFRRNSDEEAIKSAKGHADGRAMELWSFNRLIMQKLPRGGFVFWLIINATLSLA